MPARRLHFVKQKLWLLIIQSVSSKNICKLRNSPLIKNLVEGGTNRKLKSKVFGLGEAFL